MEHQHQTKPRFDSTDLRNLEDMSIPELVSLLRTAFLTEDFDRVEEVLVSRDKKIQTEILHLQEMVERERLAKFQAQEDSRNREELLCDREKRSQSYYEKLLKKVKKITSLADKDNNQELRMKKNELELEVCELRKLKEKWVDDTNALAQLRIRVGLLEDNNNTLRLKYSELEKSMEINTETLAYPRINAFKGEENVRDYEPPNKTSMSDNLPFFLTWEMRKEKNDFLKKQLEILIANKDEALTVLEALKKLFKEYYDECANPSELKEMVVFTRFQEALTANENALSKATEAFNETQEVLKENEAALWAATNFLREPMNL